jgi:hypothetical protein
MFRTLFITIVLPVLLFSGIKSLAQAESPMGEADAYTDNMEAQAIFAGQVLYLDEDLFLGGGGSIRYYFANRFGVEGEVLHLQISDYDDLLLTPYVVFRFGQRSGNKISWYLKGGVGLRHETDHRIAYTSNEAIFQAAIGLRAALSKKVYLVAEGRVIGFAFGAGYSF